ncbi:hypothetical protein HOLDEFILI_03070 [Holdemania filiformis DSM 12042]|uniref:Uncharacterized protein n=1 Tax=Holdemania filiformis DSM 12042 TaxID=545696 RepID=B9YB63_9FIRM|nr:hypothetical protein HOLDEFILI_03070 [Holdemania filiformis DSM 12042]
MIRILFYKKRSHRRIADNPMSVGKLAWGFVLLVAAKIIQIGWLCIRTS